MYIKRMAIHNFKSIVDTEIVFSPLTMVVGANAAGKSNLINVFRFIQNIIAEGIDSAIALQGGVQYIANANLPKGEPVVISFTIDLKKEHWMRHLQARKYALRVHSIDYKFIIQPNKRGLGYRIAYDYVCMKYQCFVFDPTAKRSEQYKNIRTVYEISFERKKSKSRVKFTREYQPSDIDRQFKEELENDNASIFFSLLANEEKSELMLNHLVIITAYFLGKHLYKSVRF